MRLGYGEGEIHIYKITCPVPQQYKYIVVPDCYGDIAGVIRDVLEEYLPNPFVEEKGGLDAADAHTSDGEFVEVESEDDWVVSKEFLKEYDSDAKPKDVSTF